MANLVITTTEPYQKKGNEFFVVSVFIMLLVDAKKIDESTWLKRKSMIFLPMLIVAMVIIQVII